jgi:hypothetical protein
MDLCLCLETNSCSTSEQITDISFNLNVKYHKYVKPYSLVNFASTFLRNLRLDVAYIE